MHYRCIIKINKCRQRFFLQLLKRRGMTQGDFYIRHTIALLFYLFIVILIPVLFFSVSDPQKFKIDQAAIESLIFINDIDFLARMILICMKFRLRRTCVSDSTRTVIIVDQIDACGPIFALAHAIVDVFGTGGSSPALRTCAPKCTGRVLAWYRIDAWSQVCWQIRFAFVDI